jgi:multidrug transporter EmrE-like cation transporter
MGALPKTRLGAWGFYLLLAFTVLFLLAAVANIVLMPAFAIFAIGIVGMVLNLIALFKRDFSWLGLIIGGLISAFVIFWVASELLLPH